MHCLNFISLGVVVAVVVANEIVRHCANELNNGFLQKKQKQKRK